MYPAVTTSFLRENIKMSYDFQFNPQDPALYSGAFDLIIMQRQVAEGFKPMMAHFNTVREQNKIPTVAAFEIDDWLFGIPEYNLAWDMYNNKLGIPYLREMLNMFDAMIVSTHALKKMYSEYFPVERIWVVPNLMPKWLWDFDEKDRTDFSLRGGKPKIFFAGGSNRFAVKGDDLKIKDDISQIEPIIRKTVDEWDWIFMGACPLRLSDLFDVGKIKHLPWQVNLEYPNYLRKASKGIDIAISPLLDNAFNRGKTPIKIYEYGAVGIPAIYANLTPYDELPSYMKVLPGDTAGWEERIRAFIASEQLRKDAQSEQLKILNQSWLEPRVDEYANTYWDIVNTVQKMRGYIK
jgi:O-antigen biosynthesis protein